MIPERLTPAAPVSLGNPTAATADTLVQSPEQVELSRELSRGSLNAPAQVAGYEILRPLGGGAYGAVWLAREQNTGKHVAIKFYTHRRGVDWSLLSREVEKLAVLYTSRNIVGLIDVGWDSDPPYYVMEYLQNGSLARLLDSGPLDSDEAVRIAYAVAQALVHAHGSGILHCDLKPANVLLDGDFSPRLCDFGQSRLSAEQTPALGTLYYMAPEQADTKAVPDARWDVYALGAIMYHMLCGEPPYRSAESERRLREATTLEGRLAAYRSLLWESPPPTRHRRVPGVDKRLAEIVDRCLQIAPDRRFPNAQAVLDALKSRERYRAQRPLVWLGFIGPLLLLAAMAYLVSDVLRTAESQARRNLLDRALESDALSAEILARSLNRELATQQAELVDVSLLPELREAIEFSTGKSWDERRSKFQFLEAIQQQIADQRTKLGLSTDASWFVMDGSGKQLWRHPEDLRTIDNNYKHRHYFHGNTEVGEYTLGSDSPNPPPEGLKPNPKPFVSLPFRSEATNKYMVAIRTPVWNEEHTEVIGVLARTVHLGDVLADYDTGITGEQGGKPDRTVALVDAESGRWTLLDHRWWHPPFMTETQLINLPRSTFEQLRLPQSISDQLQQFKGSDSGKTVLRVESYLDPVGQLDPANFGGEWMAAFAEVPITGWYAIVQERREAAAAPVDKLRRDVYRSALVALAISGVMILLLWSFVLSEVRNRRLRGWTRSASAVGGDASSGDSLTDVSG